MLRKLISNEVTAFDPEDIEILHRAFSEVCAALHIFASDINGQEAIATRVIDLAKGGVLNVSALRDRVLQEVHAVTEAVTVPLPQAAVFRRPADGMR
jgi:hypothetical protein